MATEGALHLSIPRHTVEALWHTVEALYHQERNSLQRYGQTIQLEVVNFHTEILRLERVMSDQTRGVHKFVNYYVAIHGMIITAIYSVQVVRMEMHCATGWVLPLLTAIASLGLISSIGIHLFHHFTALVNRQLVTHQLNVFLARHLGSNEGDLLRRSNPALFLSIFNMGMQAINRGELSVRLQCLQSIAALVVLTVFSIFTLVSCKRLSC